MRVLALGCKVSHVSMYVQNFMYVHVYEVLGFMASMGYGV